MGSALQTGEDAALRRAQALMGEEGLELTQAK